MGWTPHGLITSLVLAGFGLPWNLEWVGIFVSVALVLSIGSWGRLDLDARGVRMIHGIGPIIWRWKRIPPGGCFELRDDDDDDALLQLAYVVDDGRELDIDSVRPSQLRDLLVAAASRTWSADR